MERSRANQEDSGEEESSSFGEQEQGGDDDFEVGGTLDDDVVAAFSARDSEGLPFRECADGRVEVSRVFHQSEELGIHPGMLLNSVGPLGIKTNRTHVGMLSFGGARDQIANAAAAAGGVSLGFVWRDQPLAALPEPAEEEFEFATLQPQVMVPQRANDRMQDLPERGARFVVSFSDGAMLREGNEMDSRPSGKLRHGEVVTVLEAHRNSEGIIRLRVEGGCT